MLDEILEAWRTNHRINLFLIDRISAAGMRASLSKRGGRDVALQFAHMHNNRVWHLEKRAKDLAEGLDTFPSKVTPTKVSLRKAHDASTAAIEAFLADLMHGKPKRRGLKKGVPSTLAYFVAHESHHRGSILLTLKESGHGLDKAAAYGIWDWDRR